MAQAKHVTEVEAVDALNKLLFGKQLSHFHFGHQFQLYFGNYVDGPARPTPPIEVVVCIYSEFWINDKREWNKKVAGVPSSVVEPTAPVLAYELARLCWIAGSSVSQVANSQRNTVFTLENGETINIPVFSEDEFAFLVSDNADETRCSFSVCCVDGDFYTNSVEFLADPSWSLL